MTGIPMIGRIISHNRVLERLGAGGMCVVYKAESTRLGRLATKVAALELRGERISSPVREAERLRAEVENGHASK